MFSLGQYQAYLGPQLSHQNFHSDHFPEWGHIWAWLKSQPGLTGPIFASYNTLLVGKLVFLSWVIIIPNTPIDQVVISLMVRVVFRSRSLDPKCRWGHHCLSVREINCYQSHQQDIEKWDPKFKNMPIFLWGFFLTLLLPCVAIVNLHLNDWDIVQVWTNDK